MLAKTSLYSVFKDPYFLHRRKNIDIIPIFSGLSTPLKKFLKNFSTKYIVQKWFIFNLIFFMTSINVAYCR